MKHAFRRKAWRCKDSFLLYWHHASSLHSNQGEGMHCTRVNTTQQIHTQIPILYAQFGHNHLINASHTDAAALSCEHKTNIPLFSFFFFFFSLDGVGRRIFICIILSSFSYIRLLIVSWPRPECHSWYNTCLDEERSLWSTLWFSGIGKRLVWHCHACSLAYHWVYFFGFNFCFYTWAGMGCLLLEKWIQYTILLRT
jgi:hypothetical protein